jgi:hypothetical protein
MIHSISLRSLQKHNGRFKILTLNKGAFMLPFFLEKYMKLKDQLVVLEKQHRELDNIIVEAYKNYEQDEIINSLKYQKLLIKRRIEDLSVQI